MSEVSRALATLLERGGPTVSDLPITRALKPLEGRRYFSVLSAFLCVQSLVSPLLCLPKEEKPRERK
jgi:hypothetical protein